MCRYCKDYTEKVYNYRNDKSWFSMYEHYLEVVSNEERIEVFKINYCPMCGRKINESKLHTLEKDILTDEEVKYKMEYEQVFKPSDVDKILEELTRRD